MSDPQQAGPEISCYRCGQRVARNIPWNLLRREVYLIQSQQYIDMACRAEDRGLPDVAGNCIAWAQERLMDWKRALLDVSKEQL
jgi:hypothetical protein